MGSDGNNEKQQLGHFAGWVSHSQQHTGLHAESTENWELSRCQLCRHWWPWRLSLWQQPVPPVMTKLASWRLDTNLSSLVAPQIFIMTTASVAKVGNMITLSFQWKGKRLKLGKCCPVILWHITLLTSNSVLTQRLRQWHSNKFYWKKTCAFLFKFTDVHSWWCIWQLVIIDSDNGLAHVRYQVITWTNVDQVVWCHMASLGYNNFDGILPKGPYPPCLRMTDRALLAGYPRCIVLKKPPKSSFMGVRSGRCF